MTTTETSPLIYARLAGVLVLSLVVLGPFSQLYVPSTLIVPGDATATADNIGASGWVFRLGIVSDSLIFLIEIVVSVLLYVLLRPVSRTLSLVLAFARLAMAVIQGINLLPYFTALLLLSGAGYLTVFEPDQLDALALLFLDAHQYVVYIWEIFLGLHLFVLAYLIFKSGYFPRILGVLMVWMPAPLPGQRPERPEIPAAVTASSDRSSSDTPNWGGQFSSRVTWPPASWPTR
jgi:hypothetical protein